MGKRNKSEQNRMTQSVDDAVVNPIALCANFKSYFLKGPKPPLCQVKEAKPPISTLSFPDRLGEAELGRPGCGQGMRREGGVGSHASGCFRRVMSSTFLL